MDIAWCDIVFEIAYDSCAVRDIICYCQRYCMQYDMRYRKAILQYEITCDIVLYRMSYRMRYRDTISLYNIVCNIIMPSMRYPIQISLYDIVCYMQHHYAISHCNIVCDIAIRCRMMISYAISYTISHAISLYDIALRHRTRYLVRYHM